MYHIYRSEFLDWSKDFVKSVGKNQALMKIANIKNAQVSPKGQIRYVMVMAIGNISNLQCTQFSSIFVQMKKKISSEF